MGVPILTMVARFINAAIFLSSFVKTIHATTDAGEALEALAFHLPSIKIEWTLQLFDDMYVGSACHAAFHPYLNNLFSFSSAIFLTRVYKQTMFSHESQLISYNV